MTNTTPLESAEQKALVQWLEIQGLKFTSIPNSTYTKSWSVKRRNYAEGLRPGLADMFIVIPKIMSKDGNGYALFIENKRVRGGKQTDDQKSWELAINGLGVDNIQYYLCKGAAEAIKVVSHYLKSSNTSPF